jgi:hypothetical protein
MMTRIGMMQVEKLIRVVTLQLPARIRHREIKNSEIFGSYSWNSLWGNKYPYVLTSVRKGAMATFTSRRRQGHFSC